MIATFTDRAAASRCSKYSRTIGDPFADGVSNLYASLKIVAKTGRPHAMAVQRYDIRNSGGEFVERYWQPINTPVHDAQGSLVFLLHYVWFDSHW